MQIHKYFLRASVALTVFWLLLSAPCLAAETPKDFAKLTTATLSPGPLVAVPLHLTPGLPVQDVGRIDQAISNIQAITSLEVGRPPKRRKTEDSSSNLSFSQQGLAMENMGIDSPDRSLGAARSLSAFPIEVFSHIFSFLGQNDLLRVGGTCTRWRQSAERVWKNKPLDLSRRALRQADYKALAQGPFSSLILKNLQLGPEAACILARSSRLTALNLSFNSIGAEGAKAIAHGNLSALTTLDLHFNSLGDEGAKAIANGNLWALATLNLCLNSISDEGVKAIAGGNFSRLTRLDLGSNHIGGEGTKAIAGGTLSALTKLDLYGNGIGDEEVKAITLGNLSALTELNLYFNRIGAEGAKAIACGNFSGLTTLNLRHNRLDAEGAKAIAYGNLSRLTTLNLSGNSIGEEGRKALAKNARLHKITLIDNES